MNKKDLRENGRIILAHGEVTGHCHEVVSAIDPLTMIPPAQFFETDKGQRELVVIGEARLKHEEHNHFILWPDGSMECRDRLTDRVLVPRVPGVPPQAGQGDVLLYPTSPGTWSVKRQREQWAPDEWRQVAD